MGPDCPTLPYLKEPILSVRLFKSPKTILSRPKKKKKKRKKHLRAFAKSTESTAGAKGLIGALMFTAVVKNAIREFE